MKRLIESKIKLKESNRRICFTIKHPDITKEDTIEFEKSVENYKKTRKGNFFEFKPISYNIDIKKEYMQSSRAGNDKPKGLWYCSGDTDNDGYTGMHQWIYWLIMGRYISMYGVSEMDKNDNSIFNVNAVVIAEIPSEINILQIKNKYNLYDFSNKYSINRYHNWVAVSKNYDGIELFRDAMDREIPLVVGFDIPSGCIWRGLDKLKIISVTPFGKYVYDNKLYR